MPYPISSPSLIAFLLSYLVTPPKAWTRNVDAWWHGNCNGNSRTRDLETGILLSVYHTLPSSRHAASESPLIPIRTRHHRISESRDQLLAPWVAGQISSTNDSPYGVHGDWDWDPRGRSIRRAIEIPRFWEVSTSVSRASSFSTMEKHQRFFFALIEDSCPKNPLPRITFLYKTRKGLANKSYGLNVARLAGIDPNVLRVAHQQATMFEAQVEEQGKARICSREVLLSLITESRWVDTERVFSELLTLQDQLVQSDTHALWEEMEWNVRLHRNASFWFVGLQRHRMNELLFVKDQPLFENNDCTASCQRAFSPTSSLNGTPHRCAVQMTFKYHQWRKINHFRAFIYLDTHNIWLQSKSDHDGLTKEMRRRTTKAKRK